jgi:hypothetical protein
MLADSRSGTSYAYGYNARNRLETVTVAYTYNGLEQLASRVMTNQTPSGGGGDRADLRRARPDRPAAGRGGRGQDHPVVYFMHVDHPARPIRMTDGAKAMGASPSSSTPSPHSSRVQSSLVGGHGIVTERGGRGRA